MSAPCNCGVTLDSCPTHESEPDSLHRVIRGLVERHHDEMDRLRAENRQLKRELSDCDEKITTLQQMLERAHTEENAR